MEAARRTLLVVDDNPANRDLLSRRLERKGFHVITAEDGQRALDILATLRVDLVLLDIMMPGLSGLQVLRRLRETKTSAELPVIMVTAKGEDEVEALELGANDYVAKPIDFPVVLARVKAQLRIKRTVAAAVEPSLPSQVGPGSVLAGRYRIDSRIGVGSFGAVYEATHVELDDRVAIKILGTSVARDPEALARFRREGMSACRVSHPNAVAVRDFGVTATGVAYLVMEHLKGCSLGQEMESLGRFSPERCAQILIPVCGALGEAHRAGIVHRDVKPSNIFLHRGGRREVPKVLDFGIARLVTETVMARQLDGALLGTPAYMAPERFFSQPYDGKSDVYSLGIMLYQMLAGRLPFETSHRDPLAMAVLQRSEEPPPLSGFEPPIPAAFEELVRAILRKDPAGRPTADEVARMLAIAVGLPTRPGSVEPIATASPRVPAPVPLGTGGPEARAGSPAEAAPSVSATPVQRRPRES